MISDGRIEVPVADLVGVGPGIVKVGQKLHFYDILKFSILDLFSLLTVFLQIGLTSVKIIHFGRPNTLFRVIRTRRVHF